MLHTVLALIEVMWKVILERAFLVMPLKKTNSTIKISVMGKCRYIDPIFDLLQTE
jgi:hypothetical protein